MADIVEKTHISKLANALKGVRDEVGIEKGLILINSERIVLPTPAIKAILQRLHIGHPGQEKALALAHRLYYWHGMNNDIKSITTACQECQARLPSQPANPRVTEPPSSAFGAPMAQVGLDLFDFGGRKHLLCVDRWSGFPLYKQLQTTTTNTVTRTLSEWFNNMGWPAIIRSDGGPQFSGPFKQWCKENNIKHEVSSPYNPKANGLAEAAVKNVKSIIAKCHNTKEDVGKSLYHWRNIPRADGYSPAQLLFGRRQFSSLPAADIHYQFYNPTAAAKAKDKCFNQAERYHNNHKQFLPSLSIGDKVRVQDPHSKLWDHEGLITNIRPDGLSYSVTVGNRQLIRARKMLKKMNTMNDNTNVFPQALSPTATTKATLNRDKQGVVAAMIGIVCILGLTKLDLTFVFVWSIRFVYIRRKTLPTSVAVGAANVVVPDVSIRVTHFG